MQTRRTERLNAELQTLVSSEISESLSLSPDVICTVTKVVITSDLRSANVSISVFPENAREKTLRSLEKCRVRIEQAVYRKIPTRIKPKLSFVLDDTEERADQVEHLLKEWHEEGGGGGTL